MECMVVVKNELNIHIRNGIASEFNFTKHHIISIHFILFWINQSNKISYQNMKSFYTSLSEYLYVILYLSSKFDCVERYIWYISWNIFVELRVFVLNITTPPDPNTVIDSIDEEGVIIPVNDTLPSPLQKFVKIRAKRSRL